jgi:hypothetical protein
MRPRTKEVPSPGYQNSHNQRYRNQTRTNRPFNEESQPAGKVDYKNPQCGRFFRFSLTQIFFAENGKHKAPVAKHDKKGKPGVNHHPMEVQIKTAHGARHDGSHKAGERVCDPPGYIKHQK